MMATSTQRQRGDLPRLNIPPVPASLALQQPGMQPLYSPALPTSLQQSFLPPLPLAGHGALQTPMQPFFNPVQMLPPSAPARVGHRAGQQSMNVHMGNIGSVAQLAAAGIHPPNGFPITPMGGHFPRQSMAGFPGSMPPPHSNPFPNRNRRQLSIGGPPKAVLGGPQRKLSPNPPVSSGVLSASISGSTTPVGPPTTYAPIVKAKKLIVNIPEETIPSQEEDVAATKAPFARVPLKLEEIADTTDLRYPEITTCEEFPPEHFRHLIPPTVDVFLPGKTAWERLKHAAIERKLEKLGVEPGGSSSANSFVQPHPLHGRAASVSSPADPALLFFKLNKLQQAQQSSSLGNSLSTSPQPPFLNPPPHSASGFSPSPTSSAHIPRFITNRHGHSLSLVQPPAAGARLSPGIFRTPSTGATSNPFGPHAVLGNDQNTVRGSVSPSLPEVNSSMDLNIHAPQARKPPEEPTLFSNEPSAIAPPLSAVRSDSRPNFARGFGLDIPEEVEEEGLEEEVKIPSWALDRDAVDQVDMNLPSEEDGDIRSLEEGEREEMESNGLLTASHSRHHSRHTSRLSAALSLRSFGGLVADGLNERLAEMHSATDSGSLGLAASSTVQAGYETGRGQLPVHVPIKDRELEEWTGSEDVDGYGHVDEDDSDDESIGEWSNPSDEERARQARVEARLRRRSLALPSEQPRKLPQFPQPPENTFIVPRLMRPRDDDIISNPSEEEHGGYLGLDLRYPPSSSSASRPLPLVPSHHSRGPSSQSGIHSLHDPARAHSRVPSLGTNGDSQLPKPNLNPKATPFVFGTRGDSSSRFSFSGVAPNAPMMSHSRLPSSSNSVGFASKLNASAAEFRPGGEFSFRAPFPAPRVPPTAIPGFPTPNPVFPEPERYTDARPLPLPPAANTGFVLSAVEESPFKVQGREKRQRRDHSSSGSDAELVEGDSMASFRFPSNFGSPASLRIGVPPSPNRNSHGRVRSSLTNGSLNPTAEPFTFAGFSNAVGTLPHIGDLAGEEKASPPKENQEDLETDDEDKENNANVDVEDVFSLSLATSTKMKRAPIPLTFKQTMSNNTVPAGLFKALANHSNSNSTDERTRPTVRSRLSSREQRIREFGREVEREKEREFYEQGSKPSLDDLGVDMPAISHKASRTRLVTDPARFVSSDASPTEDDVFANASLRQAHAHARRRSSLPDNFENLRYERRSSNSSLESMSEVSSLAGPVAKDFHTRLEMKRYEERLENLLNEKFIVLVHDLKNAISNTSFQQQGLTPKAEEMISDVVSLFRTQLADSAALGLDQTHLDARGELDFELIKDVVEQGHAKILDLLTRELNNFQAQAYFRPGSGNTLQPDLSKAFEDYSSRTINATVEAVSELSTRLETITRGAPAREYDQLVDAVVSALNPVLNAIRPEAVDYDFLTSKLTQAVKPHISQIIDLASDKRETAGLIIDRLLPVLLPILQQHSSPVLDVDAIALQLTTEVRRAIAPIDAFEIKEQVADLVVERLDSRLAVRDKSFNVDSIASKITDAVSRLFDPWAENLSNTVDRQKLLSEQQSDLFSSHKYLVELITTLPAKVHSALETKTVGASELEKQVVSEESILGIKNSLGDIGSVQESLAGHSTEVLQLSKVILERMSALPESISAAVTVLQNSHSDILLTRDQTRREIEDLRRLNTDLQSQLHKARGAHGQIRVEKDMLNEKFNILEADRERLKMQGKELQAAVNLKTTEIAHVEGKNTNLEEALAKALGRLQASDVATQTNMDRIAALEKVNAEISAEKQALKVKVDSLDLKVTFAARDKENAEHAYSALQKQYDQLSSQQKHWDDLRHASEQIENLANLIGQADNEEMNELRRARDRSKMLEGEHAALQKRFKEQENRMVAMEKASTSVKQSLAQAQSRASEWEQRAKESEAKLERTSTQLEQAEQTHSQLDADYLVVKMQLEDREADERLAKDREIRLRDEVSALEAKTRQLQVELERAQVALRNSTNSHVNSKVFNRSIHAVSRPASRSSTPFIDRSVTPNGRAPSTGSITPPHNVTSVWDSIHAPSAAPTKNGLYGTPSGRYAQSLSRGPSRPPLQYSRSSIASPTPSTVSLAPTVDEEGWWS